MRHVYQLEGETGQFYERREWDREVGDVVPRKSPLFERGRCAFCGDTGRVTTEGEKLLGWYQDQDRQGNSPGVATAIFDLNGTLTFFTSWMSTEECRAATKITQALAELTWALQEARLDRYYEAFTRLLTADYDAPYGIQARLRSLTSGLERKS